MLSRQTLGACTEGTARRFDHPLGAPVLGAHSLHELSRGALPKHAPKESRPGDEETCQHPDFGDKACLCECVASASSRGRNR